VVLNRVESSQFPDSISEVIYQSGAFSVVNDGQINLAPNQQSLDAARDAMNGWDPSGGALFYYAPSKTSNQWIRSREVICTIANHVFCK
jgi:N-acetylmuramoyl-L-alanine amidase